MIGLFMSIFKGSFFDFKFFFFPNKLFSFNRIVYL